MEYSFFTVGHSNRSTQNFIDLLASPHIERVVDVRKLPGSRANPQFDGETLRENLAPFQIAYQHIAALGGLRGKGRNIPGEVNAFWTNQSFHNYADYALSADFRTGLELLLAVGERQRCAIMCSEAVWWQCHRRIIADYLIARGKTVFHIMGEGRLAPAQLTPGAVVAPNGEITYPAQA